MPSIEETLRTLRDVDGVYGSFVIAGSGALVARDLPAVFGSDLFADVGPRLIRLYEAFSSGADELDGCMVRYADHKLYARKMTWGVIAVISAVAVNMPALRMVANLVVRRIDPDVAVATSRVSSSPAPRPSEAPRERPPPPAPPPRSVRPEPLRPEPMPVVAQDGRDSSPPPRSGGHVQMYRGRPIVTE